MKQANSASISHTHPELTMKNPIIVQPVPIEVPPVTMKIIEELIKLQEITSLFIKELDNNRAPVATKKSTVVQFIQRYNLDF